MVADYWSALKPQWFAVVNEMLKKLEGFLNLTIQSIGLPHASDGNMITFTL